MITFPSMRQADLGHGEPSVESTGTTRAETARPNTAAVKAEASGAAPTVVVPLGGGRSVAVQPTGEDATILHVRGGQDRALQIELRFEASGPVVRVSASVLQLEGLHEVAASCDTFRVDARERIELRSGGEIVQYATETARIEGRRVELDASPGAIRLRANDEVQLKGEMILLNCDHPSLSRPLPEWSTGTVVVRAEPPPARASGDAGVIAELLGPNGEE